MRRLLAWMDAHGFPQFFVARPENFAWLTGGADNTVVVNEGVAWIEVQGEGLRLHTSRIEARRLKEEEIPSITDIVIYPWYSTPSIPSPNDLEHDLTPLRLVLSPEEQERFRRLGKDAACAVGEALRAAKPAWTERELAGAVAEEAYAKGIVPSVLLVAGEDRIFKYRHPLPKDKPLGRLCMVVICGRRHGLVANLTRLRVWGLAKVRETYQKLLTVEAVALEATKPGNTLREVILAIQNAYQRVGFVEAFEEHHQGGIAGYRPREIIGTPESYAKLEAGMAVAWNPSFGGTKVEDTFLITEEGLENLTVDPAWPMLEVGGRMRPDLLCT
ncbi:MAG: M24 family metallopeptidase [Deltaproteobacteria bacterium]|nr:M24 family metallopeptidase [Deltaproteobacteria bacterium]